MRDLTKNGHYLQDLVGIDTSEKVSGFILENVEGDEYIDVMKTRPNPKFMDFLVENKFFGNKSRKGFYEKTNQRDRDRNP